MRLRYRNVARIELESFIDHYKEGFRTLYGGTGLWNEDVIIASYEQRALELYDSIDDTICARLNERAVIGRKQVADDWFAVTVSVGTRLIFVLYSEDKKQLSVGSSRSPSIESQSFFEH
ncbi:MAG: hypothetical protein RLZZ416_56 [Candidatus Parcubacteria bacterium]|jgi:hypothetical protein